MNQSNGNGADTLAENLIGVKEAAGILNLTTSRVRVLIRDGRLPFVKRIESGYVLDQRQVEEFAQTHNPGGINKA